MAIFKKHIRNFQPENFINSIDPKEKFEPSTNTKELWLSVRHSKIKTGNDFPGLFSLDQFPDDKKGFFIAIFLEVVGLCFMFPQFKFILYGIGSAFTLLTLDLVCAIHGHARQKEICLNENQLKANNDIHMRATYEQKIKHNSLILSLWKTGIIVVALIKVGLFFTLQRFIMNPLTAVILVSYCVVAYYHIRRTGYYFAAIKLMKYLRDDYNMWENKVNGYCHIDEHRKYLIPEMDTSFVSPGGVVKPEGISISPVRNHKIQKDSGNYYFMTYGILFDDDLRAFKDKAGESGERYKNIIGQAGLRAQLEILNANPSPVSELETEDSKDKTGKNKNEKSQG
ncbi:MAG: hypothetical protein M0P61_05940 [Ignavibacteriaceae bacterium]|nr:hypothetical protein [Ignavibacteriaceae bacterium]